MELNALRDTVSKTYPEEWNRIKDGPRGDLVPAHAAGHYAYAVLCSDVRVSLAWGLPLDHDENRWPEAMTYDWLDGIGETEATPEFADIYLSSALVDRVMLLSVDKGHAKLPFPRGVGDAPDVAEYYVTQWEHDLCRLVDRFEHHEYETYFGRSRFKIRG